MMTVRYRYLLVSLALLAGVAYLALGSQLNNLSISSSTIRYAETVYCYLDGCLPVACPPFGCGPLVTTTISSYFSSTYSNRVLTGVVKVVSGVYFFQVGSTQYHLIFGSTSSLPLDGEMIQIIGTVVTPSTYGPVLASGGDIYVQTWSHV